MLKKDKYPSLTFYVRFLEKSNKGIALSYPDKKKMGDAKRSFVYDKDLNITKNNISIKYVNSSLPTFDYKKNIKSKISSSSSLLTFGYVTDGLKNSSKPIIVNTIPSESQDEYALLEASGTIKQIPNPNLSNTDLYLVNIIITPDR